MRIAIYNPGCCQICLKTVPMEESKNWKVDNPGGYRIFHVCPYCGHEIDNKVGPVDDNGEPISTENEGG